MAVITGDTNANNLSGTSGNDTITGDAGNDTLAGGDGLDLLDGGLDNDSLDGGSGNDTLDGGAGNDTVVGGLGNDLMYGWTGNDLLVGGSGQDSMYGEAGDDGFDLNTVTDLTGCVISGGAGNDGVDLIQGVLQLGTSLPFVEIELLDTYNTDFRGTAGNDSYDFRPFNTWSPGFNLPAEITLSAGAGNDTVWVSNTNLGSFFNTVNGEAGDDSLTGSVSSDRLNGGDGLDMLIGAGGNDTLDGGAGSDRLEGGDGNDTLNSAAGSGSDTALGGAGNDYVYAVIGIDQADGGTGTDTLDTTAYGFDYTVDLATGATNFVGESFVGFENLVSGAGSDSLTGTGDVNRIGGGGGNDTIDGGLGADSLFGGAGDDTYLLDDALDRATEDADGAGGGIDSVRSSVSVVLSSAGGASGFGIENVVLLGSGSLNATGNALANTLDGTAAANQLDGGAGADTLRGGAGDDVYSVDVGGDVIVEDADTAVGGVDTVRASGSYTLGAGLEKLVLTGSAAINGSGNALGNTIDGNTAANLIDGGDGNDLLAGNGGADTLLGGAGNDLVIGTLGGRLEGGTGTDMLTLAGIGPVDAGTSFDLGAASFALADGTVIGGFENLIATAGDEAIYGSSAANEINAGAGDDTLLGQGGNDTLTGGEGADLMVGGSGSDRFEVDNLGDLVIETGTLATDIDLVVAGVSWTLSANVEQLQLAGGAANGTGNTLANRLTGNGAGNVLDGGAGADTLVGGAGGDTYVVDSTLDVIAETSTLATEIDTVRSSANRTLGANLERLVLTGSAAVNGVGNGLANSIAGNTAANDLRGAAGNDTLAGGAGNDALDGGLGNDVLNGGTGQDLFRFTSALNATGNVDQVQGFVAADDAFQLGRAVFTTLAVGTLGAADFRLGAAAGDTSDRIVYNSATGQLFYDADGSGAGAQVLFATVTAGTALTAADFVIV